MPYNIFISIAVYNKHKQCVLVSILYENKTENISFHIIMLLDSRLIRISILSMDINNTTEAA